MKFFINTLIAVFFLSGCATNNLNKKDDKTEVSQKEEEKQDVKSIDTTYTEGLKNLESKRGKHACEDYTKFPKEDWKSHLESAYTCMKQSKWTELETIANVLSHNHLKAPWGPYYKSVISSDYKKDYLRSLWMIDLALTKSPKNAILVFQKARVKWFMKDYSESYTLMQEALKLDPSNLQAMYFIATTHYRDRDFATAIKYFKKVSKKFNRVSSYRAAYAESLFYTGKFQDSLKHYKAAASGDKKNALFYYRIGQVYKNLKKWNSAKTYLSKAIAQRKKGRSIASLPSENMEADLKYVNKKIEESKGDKNEKKSKKKS